jgi:hypothetical protein
MTETSETVRWCFFWGGTVQFREKKLKGRLCVGQSLGRPAVTRTFVTLETQDSFGGGRGCGAVRDERYPAVNRPRSIPPL